MTGLKPATYGVEVHRSNSTELHPHKIDTGNYIAVHARLGVEPDQLRPRTSLHITANPIV